MLNHLPQELINIILSGLTPKDKFNFSLNSKSAYEIYFLKEIGIITSSNIPPVDLIKQIRNKQQNIQINIKYIVTSIPFDISNDIFINDIRLNSLSHYDYRLSHYDYKIMAFIYNQKITNDIIISENKTILEKININTCIRFRHYGLRKKFLDNKNYVENYSRIYVNLNRWCPGHYKMMMLIDECECVK